MLIREGKFSAFYFLISNSFIFLLVVDTFCLHLNIAQNFWWFSLLYLLFVALYLRLNHTGFLFEVGIRSVFLGTVFSFGSFIVVYSSSEWRIFGLYMCVMSFFHYSEFLAIAWCNPKTLSISSFLLNHSTQYTIAAIASWVEFTFEVFLVPDVKRFSIISFVGFALCIFGEVLRKCAMFTGRTNFSHIVQTQKEDDHELVTHGIYKIFRHPSYVGWFYWSIGTQMVLLNPVCTIAYAIVSWRFFRDRIIHEEHTLLYFFGRDYMNYQKSVGTGLPGIKGFLLDDQLRFLPDVFLGQMKSVQDGENDGAFLGS